MPHEMLYIPAPNETQLSWRALLAGCALGGMMATINLYFALQTGWLVGGSLITAILAFAFFRGFCRQHNYTVLENNIAQTAGSGAGSISLGIGLVSVIPALQMMDHPLSLTTIYIWGFSVATLGVFYAIPLRQQFIIRDHLRFPTGIATAETVVALHAAETHDYRALVLFRFAVIAAIYTIAGYYLTFLNDLPALSWLGFAAATAWGFSLKMSPMLLGAGIIIGVRTGLSLGFGALFAWGILGPLVQHWGWVQGDIFDYSTGAQGWLLWPGVSLMVVDSLVSFLFSLKRVEKTVAQHGITTPVVADPNQVPVWWWVSGLTITSVLTIISMQIFFHIPAWLTVIALLFSWLMAAIATRAAGETDINPASAVSKMTQLSYGALAPGQAVTNLMAAGVTAAGAISCADMMQDLKTGYVLGASPRKQFFAQLCGCLTGVVFAVPVYHLFNTAYDIGGKAMPAPTAHAWRAMSELLTQGTSALPPHALVAVCIAAVVGTLFACARQSERHARWLPSGVAMGIAFVIPAFYSLDFFLGSMVLLVWQRFRPESASQYAFAVASGLLVGEGLMGIVKALLTLYGVEPFM